MKKAVQTSLFGDGFEEAKTNKKNISKENGFNNTMGRLGIYNKHDLL